MAGWGGAGHDGDVLNSAHEIGDGRSHDASAGVVFPQLLAVRGAISKEHAVRAALEHEVSSGREHAAALHDGKGDAPHLTLLDRIPGDEPAGWRWRRLRLSQKWPLVAAVEAQVVAPGIELPGGVGDEHERGSLLGREVHKTGRGVERHREPVVPSVLVG